MINDDYKFCLSHLYVVQVFHIIDSRNFRMNDECCCRSYDLLIQHNLWIINKKQMLWLHIKHKWNTRTPKRQSLALCNSNKRPVSSCSRMSMHTPRYLFRVIPWRDTEHIIVLMYNLISSELLNIIVLLISRVSVCSYYILLSFVAHSCKYFPICRYSRYQCWTPMPLVYFSALRLSLVSKSYMASCFVII